MLYAGISSKERHTRALDSLAKVGLAERKDHHPNQLSGGQQQRVAIARAIVTHPEVLLADEPTGNLDQSRGREIMELLTDLNRQGLTVVIVTHDEHLARWSTRAVRFLDGRIVKEGEEAA